MGKTTILTVDDDPLGRLLIEEILGDRGYRVVAATSCAEAEDELRAERPDAAVLDYRLPDGDALKLLRSLRAVDSGLPVVILTSHGSIELAVEAMRHGADHFLTKPPDPEILDEILRRSVDERRAGRRRRAYELQRDRHRPDPFRGTSAVIRVLEERARKVAESDRPVLLLGQTGSGKGVLARWLHEHSIRADEAFVGLNCAGLKPEFLESELFGHAKGAFTGATADKPGLLEVADRGTLFLDEIGDMDLGIQAKLLKVLEEQSYRRLGDVDERRVDLWLLAATHCDLVRRVQQQRFRADLFYRLNTFKLEIPPLSRRREDVPALAEALLESLVRKAGRPGLKLTAAARTALARQPWPGNVRELRNVLERAVLFAENNAVAAGDLHFEDDLKAATDTLEFSLEELEKRHVERVLADAGSVAAAARRLGIGRNTLYDKIRKYGIIRTRR
ncbi:MAG: sigma-54 dependent transcriptional regulator [Thermoanaerobaculia bacterium]